MGLGSISITIPSAARTRRPSEPRHQRLTGVARRPERIGAADPRHRSSVSSISVSSLALLEIRSSEWRRSSSRSRRKATSASAEIEESGVLSSCETSAEKLRSWRTIAAIRSSMPSKVAASSRQLVLRLPGLNGGRGRARSSRPRRRSSARPGGGRDRRRAGSRSRSGSGRPARGRSRRSGRALPSARRARAKPRRRRSRPSGRPLRSAPPIRRVSPSCILDVPPALRRERISKLVRRLVDEGTFDVLAVGVDPDLGVGSPFVGGSHGSSTRCPSPRLPRARPTPGRRAGGWRRRRGSSAAPG